MTNEAFLKNLQAITAKEQNAQTTAEFAAAFLEGCAEELKIYTMGITAPDNADEVHPLFIGPENNRMMLCYTSTEEAGKFHRKLAEQDTRKLICMHVAAETVLSTALADPAVQAIGFDLDGDHSVVVGRAVFEAILHK